MKSHITFKSSSLSTIRSWMFIVGAAYLVAAAVAILTDPQHSALVSLVFQRQL